MILSITLALFVIGLFGTLLLYTKTLTQKIRENIEIQVYLDKNVTENQRIKILKTLSSKPYIAKEDGQPMITFVSKDEAAEQFIKETGEDFSDFLGDNPLRDAYQVKVLMDFQNQEGLSKVKSDIESINGVFEVDYVENLVNSINQNIAKISLFLLSFAGILLITVVILINNTIKLALFSQRFIIRSMQLVGAKSGFIKQPFLLRSILHGMISGALSCLLLVALIRYANQNIEGLETIQDNNLLITLFTIIIILGGIIGFFSTYRAMAKYLKMSLDDLY